MDIEEDDVVDITSHTKENHDTTNLSKEFLQFIYTSLFIHPYFLNIHTCFKFPILNSSQLINIVTHQEETKWTKRLDEN